MQRLVCGSTFEAAAADREIVEGRVLVLALVHLRQGQVAAADPLLKQVDAALSVRAKNISATDEWGCVVFAEVRTLRDEAQSLLRSVRRE